MITHCFRCKGSWEPGRAKILCPHCGHDFTPDLNWMRKRAKKLKKELGLQHAKALDEVARESGFKNWKHVNEEVKERLGL